MTELKIVSERSEVETAKKRAEDQLKVSVRILAANLLRVIAGAAREHALYREIMECAVGVQACAKLDMAPGEISLGIAHHEVERFENASPDDLERWSRDGTFEQEYARRKIVKGALRKVASDMAGHTTQSRAAERMIVEGARELEAAFEKYRGHADLPSGKAAAVTRAPKRSSPRRPGSSENEL